MTHTSVVIQRNAAVTIQAAFRGFHVRQQMAKLREEYTKILIELNDDSISSVWWPHDCVCEPSTIDKKVASKLQDQVSEILSPPTEHLEAHVDAPPSPISPTPTTLDEKPPITTSVPPTIQPPKAPAYLDSPTQPRNLANMDSRDSSHNTALPTVPPKLPPSILDNQSRPSFYESEETLKGIKEARRLHLEEELRWANQAIKNRKEHLNMMKRLKKLNTAT